MSELFEILAVTPAPAGTMALFLSKADPFFHWQPVYGFGRMAKDGIDSTAWFALVLESDNGLLLPAFIDNAFYGIIHAGQRETFLGDPLPNGSFSKIHHMETQYWKLMHMWEDGTTVPQYFQKLYAELKDASATCRLGERYQRMEAALKKIDQAMFHFNFQQFLESAGAEE